MDLPIGKGRLSTICNCLFPYFALPIAYFTLPIAYFILLIAYFALPIAYTLPIAYFALPISILRTAYCLLHTAYCLLTEVVEARRFKTALLQVPYLNIVTKPLMALAVGFLRKM